VPRLLPRLLVLALAASCGSPDGEPEVVPAPFEGFCEIEVDGIGTLDLEGDYLPHVVQCENGGAGPEALAAQAISARSYAYYKIQTSGRIADGTSDQVYSCGKTPALEHVEAVERTRGVVLAYADVPIAAFYVAGAKPSDRETCVAVAGDDDPTNTERWVTYNEGRAGNEVEQTPLGWVDPSNVRNRGCMSQWGSRCLEERGDSFATIARFYYGADIVLARAEGCAPAPTSFAPPPPGPWSPAMRIGARD